MKTLAQTDSSSDLKRRIHVTGLTRTFGSTGRDLEVGKVAIGAIAGPQADEPAATVRQLIDDQRGRDGAVDEDGDLAALDDNAGMEPVVGIGDGAHGSFVLARRIGP